MQVWSSFLLGPWTVKELNVPKMKCSEIKCPERRTNDLTLLTLPNVDGKLVTVLLFWSNRNYGSSRRSKRYTCAVRTILSWTAALHICLVPRKNRSTYSKFMFSHLRKTYTNRFGKFGKFAVVYRKTTDSNRFEKRYIKKLIPEDTVKPVKHQWVLPQRSRG